MKFRCFFTIIRIFDLRLCEVKVPAGPGVLNRKQIRRGEALSGHQKSIEFFVEKDC